MRVRERLPPTSWEALCRESGGRSRAAGRRLTTSGRDGAQHILSGARTTYAAAPSAPRAAVVHIWHEEGGDAGRREESAQRTHEVPGRVGGTRTGERTGGGAGNGECELGVVRGQRTVRCAQLLSLRCQGNAYVHRDACPRARMQLGAPGILAYDYEGLRAWRPNSTCSFRTELKCDPPR
ncbi:hypothetical protein VTO73DRAFT_2776 [Trametes versicolor]